MTSRFKVGDVVRVVRNAEAYEFPQFTVDELDSADVDGLTLYSKAVGWVYEEHVELAGPVRRTHTLPVDSVARKEYPMFRGLLQYAPAALAGVAMVSKLGNDKHNPGEPLHHARGKSTDHPDCIIRHMTDMSEDFGAGVGRDEKGVPQVLYLAWRALMLAQEWLEQNDGAPLAPAAREGSK